MIRNLVATEGPNFNGNMKPGITAMILIAAVAAIEMITDSNYSLKGHRSKDGDTDFELKKSESEIEGL